MTAMQNGRGSSAAGVIKHCDPMNPSGSIAVGSGARTLRVHQAASWLTFVASTSMSLAWDGCRVGNPSRELLGAVAADSRTKMVSFLPAGVPLGFQ